MFIPSQRSFTNKSSNRRSGAARLALEPLESRIALTAGILDATFGGGDGIVTNYMSPETLADGGLLLNGTKMVAFGTVQGATRTSGSGRNATTVTDPADFAVARYNNDGSLDSSFGTGGKVTTSFGLSVDANISDHAASAAIDADGNYVVVGRTYQSHSVQVGKKTNTYASWDFAIARFTPSGQLDATFGNQGKVLLEFAAANLDGNDEALAVVIQSDGKIIVGGTHMPGPSSLRQFALARFNANGTLDTSFGSGGKVLTDLGPQTDLLNDIELQTVGGVTRIVAAGRTDIGTYANFNYNLALVRYNLSGALDSTFGTGGIVRTDLGDRWDVINDIEVASDGAIIAGCGLQYSDASGSDMTVVRYEPNGTVGWTTVINRPFIQIMSNIALEPDGDIVVAGSSYNSSTTSQGRQSMAARLLPTGQLDSTFGTGGVALWDVNPANNGVNDEGVSGVAVQSDGKILVLGSIRPVGAAERTDWCITRLTSDEPMTPPAEGSAEQSLDLAILALMADESVND